MYYILLVWAGFFWICFVFVVVVVCSPLGRLLISLKHFSLMHLFPSF